MLASVMATGCASKAGWSLSSARTCAPASTPRICVLSEPDYGHVLRLGDASLLPGECLAAGEDARPGLIRVAIEDPEGDTRKRWVSARRGRFTLLRVDEAGKLSVERERCGDTPVSLDP